MKIPYVNLKKQWSTEKMKLPNECRAGRCKWEVSKDTSLSRPRVTSGAAAAPPCFSADPSAASFFSGAPAPPASARDATAADSSCCLFFCF